MRLCRLSASHRCISGSAQNRLPSFYLSADASRANATTEKLPFSAVRLQTRQEPSPGGLWSGGPGLQRPPGVMGGGVIVTLTASLHLQRFHKCPLSKLKYVKPSLTSAAGTFPLCLRNLLRPPPRRTPTGAAHRLTATVQDGTVQTPLMICFSGM